MVPADTCRDAGGHDIIREIPRHEGAGADEAIGPDRASGHHRRTDADERPCPDHTTVAPTVAPTDT